MEDDTCIGINMSTNAGIITSAIEDAVRIQLYSFHKRRLSKVNCSAFRYYITLAEKPIFSIAPIWNQFNEVHNDIFDILSDTELYAGTKMPISLSKIWKSYTLIRPDAERRESFRKTFRRFKCWMKKNPCFIEQMQKNPCYKIQL
ncbi:MAG: hypothetical protein QXS27_05150, partial [Candidatus Jordarchaeaceae archaeon]